MKLHADEPGVFGNLHDLGQPSVRRPAGHDKPVLGELAGVAGIDLVAVPMTFTDFRATIDFGDTAVRFENRRVCAEPHGAAEITAFLPRFERVAFRPFGHQSNDWMTRI